MSNGKSVEKVLAGLKQFDDVDGEVQNTLIWYDHAEGKFKLVEPWKAAAIFNQIESSGEALPLKMTEQSREKLDPKDPLFYQKQIL